MYDDHYGLTGRPFQLTPDPAFWFDSATHSKAMAYLGYGLAQGEGFIVITGEVGAGKTTLVAHLMETIDHAALNIIQLVSTQVDGDDVLRLTAQAMGIESEGLAKAQLLDRIERALHAVARGGKRTLLIVDEAQSLGLTAIEELRMLSNFTVGGHALLQIFLLGQPEFRTALHGGEGLEQLRQRVIATHHLEPMDAAEIEPYLAHRLALVGWKGRPDFTTAACAALYRASGGIPRVINQLASRAMLFGSVEGVDVIDETVVAAVVADQAGDAPAPRAAPVQPTRLHLAPDPQPQSNAAPDPALTDRVGELAARLEEQDAALRRVLQLLVEWAERDAPAPPDYAAMRGSAA